MENLNFSLFSRPSADAVRRSVLAETLDDALRGTTERDRWEVNTGGMWCGVSPSDCTLRRQGWKLHVAATQASAQEVLSASLPILLDAGSPFKFVSTLDHVAVLNSRHTPRGYSGKFITIYPESDEEAVRLAKALHVATQTLSGPRILSDRPYLPGSLVHYRYGAFVEQRQISHDGFYAWVVYDPEGNPVEDRRVGQYLPPPWVECPFPDPGGNDRGMRAGKRVDRAGRRDGGVLLGDRFRVREAIRHTNRGGIYRAVDTDTGADVVIKEARPYVGVDDNGRDERDRLRTEARMLELLAPERLAPAVLAVFEQAGHLFLAEELVPGVPLRQWVGDRIHEGGFGRAVPNGMSLAPRLVESLAAAHRCGMIVRDFNPNNIMVRPDGRLQLIDLELAAITEESQNADLPDPPLRVGTPGFSAPEQLAGAAPAREADLYSLGATLCFVALGAPPTLLEDVPASRPWRDRVADWLRIRWEGSGLPSELPAIIVGLTDDDPGRRTSLPEATAAIEAACTVDRSHESTPRRVETAGRKTRRLDAPRLEQGIDGIVGYLTDAMTPDDDERLWPVSCAHGVPDPCTVQHGAAGVLGVLTRCLSLTGDPRLPAAMRTAGEWLVGRLANVQRPPGLYFGQAGIAWALYDAGRELGEQAFIDQALAIAHALPTSAVSPDITHGTAGIGLALLHFAHRTGDPEFTKRAGEAADALIAAADSGPGGVSWGTPAEADSRLAGRRYYGFAHGTAGAAYFLLAAAAATGRDDCLTMARHAGETLAGCAIVHDDVALWGAGTGDAATAPHWCHGASGIGTFLARLHTQTGEERFGVLASMAARAVEHNAGRGVLAQCHGGAGNGEFLLDLAQSTGDPRYKSAAQRMARMIDTVSAVRDGRTVFPDEQGGLTATWGDGMPGVLAFLLRLRHGSPRMWMVDELFGWSGDDDR